MSKEIVLTHMFTGDYLMDNIGHEIINLYDDDSGDHYIYLCSDGRFNRKIHPVPELVVLVRRPDKSRGLLEIIGVARKLTYIENTDSFQKNVRYGGVPVEKIFASNLNQQEVCLTFKADEMLWPKSPVYIYHGENADADVPGNRVNKDIFIAESFSTSRLLREYFDDSTKNYAIFNKIVNNDNWEVRSTGISKEELDRPYPVNSMEVYGIQHRELSFSNAIKYFLEVFPDLLSRFIDFLQCPNINININVNSNNIIVAREKYHTDLLIETDTSLIVVENKIFSDINESKFLGNQLDDYERKVKSLDRYKGKSFYFYLLLPDHNNIELTKKNKNWAKIKYSQVRDFLESIPEAKRDLKLADFLNSISDHSQKDYKHSVMRKKFIRAIKSAKR